MELGNAIFGNSRGEFPIERSCGWEDVFFELLTAMNPESPNGYGENFDNEIFSMMPYYWGDCTCGCDCPIHKKACDKETKWSQWVEDRIEFACGKADKNGFAQIDISKFPKFEKKNPAPKCTCGAEKEWVVGDKHKSDCLLMRPNFHYKPTSFQIQWYKYPFRDSYMNEALELDDFRKIIKECIASL